jgi:hypothetical protein
LIKLPEEEEAEEAEEKEEKKEQEARDEKEENDEMEGEKDEQDAINVCGPTSGMLVDGAMGADGGVSSPVEPPAPRPPTLFPRGASFTVPCRPPAQKLRQLLPDKDAGPIGTVRIVTAKLVTRQAALTADAPVTPSDVDSFVTYLHAKHVSQTDTMSRLLRYAPQYTPDTVQRDLVFKLVPAWAQPQSCVDGLRDPMFNGISGTTLMSGY